MVQAHNLITLNVKVNNIDACSKLATNFIRCLRQHEGLVQDPSYIHQQKNVVTMKDGAIRQ